MLYLDLPTGDGHGWGICGDNLANALIALAPACRVQPGEFATEPAPGPLLENCWNSQLRSRHPRHASGPHAGYVVFEDDELVRRAARQAADQFDVFVTPSDWCERVLRGGGLRQVLTIPHGVDLARFNPSRAARTRFADQFVVFSGGKLEFRKAQDVVVRAFRHFASRHGDVLLLAAWYNPYGQKHARSMAASPYLPYDPDPNERFSTTLERWLLGAGIARERFELVPPLSNAQLAEVYGDSDVGLFPNRCEGATNLVMMEYMACGKPVIATMFGGHRDIVTETNSLPLEALTFAPFIRDGLHVATWCEPDVDEVVERLEYAYQERETLRDIGATAARDMTRFTWTHTAARFLEVLAPSARGVAPHTHGDPSSTRA